MATESTTARPYSRAIFELASERGGYDQWSNRLAFWSAVVTDDAIRTRLAEPGITAKAKADLIAEVSDGLDDDSRSLLQLLADGGDKRWRRRGGHCEVGGRLLGLLLLLLLLQLLLLLVDLALNHREVLEDSCHSGSCGLGIPDAGICKRSPM